MSKLQIEYKPQKDPIVQGDFVLREKGNQICLSREGIHTIGYFNQLNTAVKIAISLLERYEIYPNFFLKTELSIFQLEVKE